MSEESKLLISMDYNSETRTGVLLPDGRVIYNEKTYISMIDLLPEMAGYKSSSLFSKIKFADSNDLQNVIYYDDITLCNIDGAQCIGKYTGQEKLKKIYCLLKDNFDDVQKWIHAQKLLKKMEEEQMNFNNELDEVMDTLTNYLKEKESCTQEQRNMIIMRLLETTRRFVQK